MKTQVTAILLIVLLHVSNLSRQTSAASYRYPVQHTVSARDAMKEYEGLLRKIESIRNPGGTDAPQPAAAVEPFGCPGVDGSARLCVGEADMRYYVGEYLPYATNSPALVPASSSADDGGGAEPGWVPAGKVVGGEELLKQLAEAREKKEPQDCDGRTGVCKKVVEAVAAGEGERALAVCDVGWVGEETGAVRNCVPVAVIKGGETYIRSAVGYTAGKALPASPDEWGAVVEYHIVRGSEDAPMPSTESLLRLARDVLGQEPLSLKTELYPGDAPQRVVGVAGPPHAAILPSADREKVSVTVDVIRDEAGGVTLKASFSAQLHRNKEKGTRPEDFRLPDQSELSFYENLFEGPILGRLPGVCRRAMFKELRTMVCRGAFPERAR